MYILPCTKNVERILAEIDLEILSYLHRWRKTRWVIVLITLCSIQCESQKKGNPDLISNLWKTKRRITKLITGNDSTTILLSFYTLITQIGYRMTDQHSFFVITFFQVLSISSIELRLKENRVWLKISLKLKTDITKLISAHDSIISQL